ncbi:DinB family protein [Nocardiopsis suaedae]|uniref:DinB family protein n=1 Tax=Nocardiopsis suaedae TaxID=3018444 RepID=A0ABT4TJC9_9ACTN|nr:DinB family protein [Nocardiopsis suaedae]MDA2804515.1 DinB family protein [Nocardiopsis suaedae]
MDALQRVMAAAPEGGEREVLESFLDAFRVSVEEKAAGLSDGDARRRLVPSRTTLAGLLRHLALVERNWFGHVLQGIPSGELGLDPTDPDSTWELRPGDTVASLTEDYRRACAESRAAAARFALEDAVPQPELGRVTLRWIYVHMIEETARHAGHADILREQTDGSTGRFAAEHERH